MSEIIYAKRLLKGSSMVFIGLIISQIIMFLLRMFLARELSVEEYGFFYTILALFTTLRVFNSLGLETALTKYIPEFKVKKQIHKIKSSISFVLLSQMILSLIVVIVVILFSNQIIQIFSTPEDLAIVGTDRALEVLKILSVWFIVIIIPVAFRVTFNGLHDIPIYTLTRVFESLFIFVFAVILIGSFGMGISGAASAYVLAFLSLAIFGFWALRKRHRYVFGKKINIKKPLVKKLMLFSLPLFIGGIGGIAISNLDTLMIAKFLSSEQVGLYQAAKPAAQLLAYAMTSLVVILFPMVSEILAKQKFELLKKVIHFLFKFSFILMIPAALIFIAFPHIVITLIFGSKYLGATTALQILTIGVCFSMLYGIFSSIINGMGKTIINMKIAYIMGGSNILASLLLIPRYGIEGAAIAMVLVYAIGFILSVFFVRRLAKFSVPASALLKALIGGIITLFLIAILKEVLALSPLLELFFVMVPAVVFYGMWILATKGLTKNDLYLLARVLPIPGRIILFAKKFVK